MKIKELSIEEELALEKNLVWVFGDRRSGTTWLARELLSYQTKTIDEPLIGLHVGWSRPLTDGFTRTIDIQKHRDDYFFSEKYANVWKFFLRKLILNRIYDQFKTVSDTIVIKEPTGSMAADIITECLPNSKIIVIFRDGRDVVDSKIDESSPGGWEIELKKGIRKPILENAKMNWIVTFSKMWVSLMEILIKTYERHDKNLRYQLRYEDLRKNTLSELTKIYQFIGIKVVQNTLTEIIEKYSFENIPKNKKGKGQFRRFATPGKWAENFNENEKKKLEKIMKPTLEKLGY